MPWNSSIAKNKVYGDQRRSNNWNDLGWLWNLLRRTRIYVFHILELAYQR